MSYLDDEQVASVDYCLPLPCSDQHLCDFIDWLVITAMAEQSPSRPAQDHEQRRIARKRQMQRIRSVLTGTAAPPSSASVKEPQGQSVSPLSLTMLVSQLSNPQLWRRHCRSYLNSAYHELQQPENWFVTPLPEGSLENFTKWRWLNPANSWRHRSVELWITSLPRIIVTVFASNYKFAIQPVVLIYGVSIAALNLFKNSIYTWLLHPCGIHLRTYWMATTIVMIVEGIWVMIHVGSLTPPQHYGSMTLTAFLTTYSNNGISGKQYLFMLISMTAYSRLFMLYQIHPVSIVGLLILLVRQTQFTWLVMGNVFSIQICQFLQLMLLQIMLLNLIYMVHMEDTYRQEFKTVWTHVLEKAFLEQCLDICQQDIHQPLERLVDLQERLLQTVAGACSVRKVLVCRTLLCGLEPLHVARALFAEMVKELAYSGHPLLTCAELPEDVVIRPDLEKVQLSRAVSKIISSFSSAAEGHHVKIFAEIDTSLAVIQVDWSMLSVILTNLVATALRNIRDYCIEQPRNKDLTNYILLKFVAIPSTEKVPFVAPRLMLINVCDSSNAAQKAVHAATRVQERENSPEYFAWNGAAASGDGNRERDGDRGKDREWESERDGSMSSQYGQSVCERLVCRVSPNPIFETIAVQTELSTVQRFTFPYHLTPQTHRAQEFIEAETDTGHLTVGVRTSTYLSSYQRLILSSPCKDHSVKASPNKQLVYLSGQTTAQRSEMTRFIKRFEAFGWKCSIKYILNLPSMHSVAGADCILLDQQLESISNVNISDTVCKLRCCGYNGVISVLLGAVDVDLSLIHI